MRACMCTNTDKTNESNINNKNNNNTKASPPETHRPINPISSMRRHMFVNSRRSGAQTTVDHLGLRMGGGGGTGGAGGVFGYGGGGTGGGAYDSLVSYDGPPSGFMVSASFASNSNVSYKDPFSAGGGGTGSATSSSPLQTTSMMVNKSNNGNNNNPNATTTITTTKVEIINEYAVVSQIIQLFIQFSFNQLSRSSEKITQRNWK